MDASLFLFPFLGFTVALVATAVGGGGGAFYVPLLVILFGVDPKTAVATSLAALFPTTLIGSVGHRLRGNVDAKAGAIMGTGSVAGAQLGAELSGYLSSSALQRIFGAFLIAVAIPLAVSRWRS